MEVERGPLLAEFCTSRSLSRRGTAGCRLVDARALYARLMFQMTDVVPGKQTYGKSFFQEFWSLKL